MNQKIYPILFLVILLTSCSGENRSNTSPQLSFETDSISVKLKYAEVYFTVPSPNQTSILLKNCGVAYDDKLICKTSSLETFTTTTKKSLALGVIGADLSYLNLYEQREKALKHLQMAENLMDDLEISPSLNKDFVKKLEKNFGNNDSVIYYLSEIYRSSDLYLKANDRRDICSLIVAGGWIESFFFLTQIYKDTNKDEIFDLILYQIDILENLIKLLAPFYEKSSEYTQLVDDLVNIAYEFDVVDKISSVISIKSDSIHWKNSINNHTRYQLSGTKLKNIASYALNLRNKIIQL